MQSLRREELCVEGAFVVLGNVFSDHRGTFRELFNFDTFPRGAAGEAPPTWQQISCSVSGEHVVRGLHCSPYPKYVSCVQGTVEDVLVDLRPSSPTFLHWTRVTLSARNAVSVFVPAGCGHSFFSEAPDATLVYAQGGTYGVGGKDINIRWNDPGIGIKWPSLSGGREVVVSDKDKNGPTVSDVFGVQGPAPGRVLVIGASGQVGAILCETLGQRVAVGTYATAPGKWGRVKLSLESAAQDAPTLLRRVRPDTVIICAAMTWVDKCEEQPEQAQLLNATAPGLIAAAAVEVGARVVYISTDYVFDGKGNVPYDEKSECNPNNVYGRSKLEGERAVLAAAPNALILRTAGVYGPDVSRKNFVYQMWKKRAEQSIPVVEDQVGTPTYSKDLAQACIALLQANATGVFHVAGPDVLRRSDFARIILQGPRDQVKDILTASLTLKAPRPHYSALSTRKLSETLPGFRMRGVEEALKDWGIRDEKDI